jgi:hypothetical protein
MILRTRILESACHPEARRIPDGRGISLGMRRSPRGKPNREPSHLKELGMTTLLRCMPILKIHCGVAA